MVVNLLICLCVLVFVVENVVFRNVFRLGDVIKICKGIIVEIDNIDVEGCLVLCDVFVEV